MRSTNTVSDIFCTELYFSSNFMKFSLQSSYLFFQSGVAKKPYNPILGEYFVCSMDTTPTTNSQQQQPTNTTAQQSNDPLSTNDEDDEDRVSRGPDGRVYFVAEQVSHHPPSKSKSNISSSFFFITAT